MLTYIVFPGIFITMYVSSSMEGILPTSWQYGSQSTALNGILPSKMHFSKLIPSSPFLFLRVFVRVICLGMADLGRVF